MTVEHLHQLEAIGITLPAWGAYTLISRLIFTALTGLVALIIFLRKPGEWMPLFVAFFLLTFSANNGVINALGLASAAWAFPAQCLTAATWVSFLLFFTLFPSGHFAPRWMRWVVIAYRRAAAVEDLFSRHTSGYWPISAVVCDGLFPQPVCEHACGAGLPLPPHLHTNSAPADQVGGLWHQHDVGSGDRIYPAHDCSARPTPNPPSFLILSGGLANYILLLLPLSIGAAMIRSRLWEIDILINRTLVYGVLTLVIGASYVLIVGALSSLFKIQDDLWVSLLVTGSGCRSVSAPARAATAGSQPVDVRSTR